MFPAVTAPLSQYTDNTNILLNQVINWFNFIRIAR